MAKNASGDVTMRVRMGESELEVTGPRQFVEQKIQDFVGNYEARKAKGGPPKARKKSRGGAQPEEEKQEAKGIDRTALVNDLKNRPDFDTISERILHRPTLWPKIQLVLHVADAFMTSGEVHKVLAGFDLTHGLSTVSKSLKANSNKLVRTGPRKKGAVVGYKLSGPARSEFGKWLQDAFK